MEHTPNARNVPSHVVVNCEGKSFGQQAMIPETTSMNSRKDPQRLNVRKERLQEIRPNSLFLPFVKTKAFHQVGNRQI